MAKTVADKMCLGDEVPMIISATAHYSKFSDVVLQAVGLHSETRTDDACKLMEKALRLTEHPAKHKMLWQDIHGSRYHKTVHNLVLLVYLFVCSTLLLYTKCGKDNYRLRPTYMELGCK